MRIGATGCMSSASGRGMVAIISLAAMIVGNARKCGLCRRLGLSAGLKPIAASTAPSRSAPVTLSVGSWIARKPMPRRLRAAQLKHARQDDRLGDVGHHECELAPARRGVDVASQLQALIQQGERLPDAARDGFRERRRHDAAGHAHEDAVIEVLPQLAHPMPSTNGTAWPCSAPLPAPRLDEVLRDPLRRADRRFIALVSDDTGEAGGVFPSIFLGIQTFAPGERIVPHRHNSYALYHIIEGEGYSVLDGQRFDWKKGDTFACPPMASHEHINTGTVPAIQYVIQDMPARAMDRNLVWEDPIGRLFHMVEGKAPTRTRR